MTLKDIFLGKPLHWLMLAVVIAALYGLGATSLHVRYFVPFCLILLGLGTACVALILSTTRRGDRVTRDPIDEA